ncbi:SRPBCC domain-containing protein [Arthrobacter cryoconiti]|uniref:SRPBCC domain-containing protein n=1 Tax=Arthrobacter cryoconiti TaxID=748907 RepID=A0ABV8QXT4_9MICC|nr:SRPBCC domain-containing protein [Arthrobacter cryoconiti]MCC9067674.1 SRPBCC domain-containing protein [Arthrobacter cryoconiti]
MESNTDLNKDMKRFAPGTVDVQEDGSMVLTLTRTYAAAPADVWAMLTQPEKTELWWAKVRGKAQTGSPFDLKWLNVKDEHGHADETEWWNGRVIQGQAPDVLEISNAMHGTIRVELSADGTGTKMVFANIISVPKDVALMSLSGWHVHLDHLAEALDGKKVDWAHWWDDFYPCWEQVHAAYQSADR